MKVFSGVRGCAFALFLLLPLGPVPAPARQDGIADPVEKFLRGYELVTIDLGSAAKGAGGVEAFSIESPSMRFDVRLEPRDLRAAGARTVETLEDGTKREAPAADVRTYAGTAANVPDSVVRFTAAADGLVGTIVTEGETYFVEPLSRYSLAGGPTDYVLYGLSDLNPAAYGDAGCATTGAERVLEAAGHLEAAAAGAGKDEARVVEIATEADDELVSALGGAQAANAEILSILNQVEALYEAELDVTFAVVHQNTYGGRDPYSSTTDAQQLLGEFRDRWNSAEAGVARDLAHLWTGRDLAGSTVGIAYIGVLCSSPSYGYGLSQRMSSAPGKFILSSHEIGHNLGACHADTDCNSNPSACRNTVMASSVGTGFTFCPFSRDQIRTYLAANGSCLGTARLGPEAPSELRARAEGTSQVLLTWRDNSRGETGFVVERRTRGGSWTRIATMGANATAYADGRVTAGTKYRYRVRAVSGARASSWSNKAAATPGRG